MISILLSTYFDCSLTHHPLLLQIDFLIQPKIWTQEYQPNSASDLILNTFLQTNVVKVESKKYFSNFYSNSYICNISRVTMNKKSTGSNGYFVEKLWNISIKPWTSSSTADDEWSLNIVNMILYFIFTVFHIKLQSWIDMVDFCQTSHCCVFSLFVFSHISNKQFSFS